MKKTLLFAVAVVFAGMVNAQDCTPLINYSASTPGLNPDPPAGSVAGVPYDEVNTLIIPRSVDNTLSAPPGDSIDLCAVGILQVIGMPAGYDYDVWAFHTTQPTSNYDVIALPGPNADTIHIFQTVSITRVCVRLKNPTPPASSNMTDGMLDRDTAIIKIAVSAWADLGFGCADLSGSGGTDTFEVHLAIKDAIYAGIEDDQLNTFSVLPNNPNPANDLTYLNFSLPTAGDVSITVYDGVGRNVRTAKIGGNQGVNNYALSTSDLRSGIYMYNITYNGKTISKKLIVNR